MCPVKLVVGVPIACTGVKMFRYFVVITGKHEHFCLAVFGDGAILSEQSLLGPRAPSQVSRLATLTSFRYLSICDNDREYINWLRSKETVIFSFTEGEGVKWSIDVSEGNLQNGSVEEYTI